MGAKALNEKTLTVEEIDSLFFTILSLQCEAATGEAANSTASIFDLSSTYISQPEFEVLQEFYDLYFKASHEVEARKNAINDEVDDLFETLKSQHERGEDLTVPEEDEDRKKERLSLAAIQKRLETLITLDNGIRDKILPALASMQCEDAVRQRVEHIRSGWQRLIEGDRSRDFEPDLREMAKLMSSVEESRDYYRIVFDEEAPAGIEERSVFLEF